MIVLDTNVLSALMREVPDVPVIDWLNQQPAESIWITSITVFAARFGIALLPSGRRRRDLESSFERLLVDDLEGRVLDFDQPAADAAASLAATRQLGGRVIDLRDTQIAGIVQARRAKIATRNTKHFSDLNVEVINPWEPK